MTTDRHYKTPAHIREKARRRAEAARRARGVQPYKPLAQRLCENVIATRDGCLEWSGTRCESGHGQVQFNGRLDRAHRVAWQIEHGPIPDGMHVLHRCDNPPCVNVDHLFLGTHVENMQDRDSKGRCRKGSAHRSAKVDENTVREIRADTRPLTVLSTVYGLSPSTLSSMRSRKTWKHVT